jgi:Zn finger protein HypA/HybF involved in hydrogenase expression
MITCPNCNHSYIPRNNNRKCPKCKNILPKEIIQAIAAMLDNKFCYRCGHEWQAMADRIIVRCPKCNSEKWNRPRTQYKGPFDSRRIKYYPGGIMALYEIIE